MPLTRPLKKGTKIVCKKREYGNETVNKVYILSQDYPYTSSFNVRIVKDDNNNKNGYHGHQFDEYHESHLPDFL